MKRIVLVVLALFLAGCAPKFPEQANLNLHVEAQSTGVFRDGVTATLRGRDDRGYDEIAVYQINRDPVARIGNRNAPHVVVSERLAIGFREQGLLFDNSAPAHILLEINELLATVTKPKLLYSTEAISRISVTVTNDGDSLTKRYRKESTRGSMRRPGLEELETLLNDQLSDIVQQILQDTEIRQTIIGKR